MPTRGGRVGERHRVPDDDTDHPWFAAFATVLLLAPIGGVTYGVLRAMFEVSIRSAAGVALGVVLGPALLALFWPRGVVERIGAAWQLAWTLLMNISRVGG